MKALFFATLLMMACGPNDPPEVDQAVDAGVTVDAGCTVTVVKPPEHEHCHKHHKHDHRCHGHH